MSNNDDPLIRISFNWSKLKHYLGLGLGLAGKLGKEIIKIILKLLTLLVIGLAKIYLAISKFAKSKQSGFWILLLIFLLIFTMFSLNKPLMEGQENYRKLEQKYEQQLEEYQDLMEKNHELEKRLEELENKPPTVIYRYKSQGLDSEIKQIIAKYADSYGVNQSLMECIVNWESGGNPNAVSSNGKYVGVAQYCLSTFLAHRRYLGLSEEDLRTNPDASIQLLAAALARGEGGHWPTAYPVCS